MAEYSDENAIYHEGEITIKLFSEQIVTDPRYNPDSFIRILIRVDDDTLMVARIAGAVSDSEGNLYLEFEADDAVQV